MTATTTKTRVRTQPLAPGEVASVCQVAMMLRRLIDSGTDETAAFAMVAAKLPESYAVVSKLIRARRFQITLDEFAAMYGTEEVAA